MRKYGAEAYQERRGKALTHIQFVLDQAVQGRHFFSGQLEKLRAVEESRCRLALDPVRNTATEARMSLTAWVMDALRVEDPDLRADMAAFDCQISN
ncbi:MAG: hypothetical protein WKF84_20990 [Pyrinomonadaceae bacterium]